jgi:hypothetical protein
MVNGFAVRIGQIPGKAHNRSRPGFHEGGKVPGFFIGSIRFGIAVGKRHAGFYNPRSLENSENAGSGFEVFLPPSYWRIDEFIARRIQDSLAVFLVANPVFPEPRKGSNQYHSYR